MALARKRPVQPPTAQGPAERETRWLSSLFLAPAPHHPLHREWRANRAILSRNGPQSRPKRYLFAAILTKSAPAEQGQSAQREVSHDNRSQEPSRQFQMPPHPESGKQDLCLFQLAARGKERAEGHLQTALLDEGAAGKSAPA